MVNKVLQMIKQNEHQTKNEIRDLPNKILFYQIHSSGIIKA